MAINESVKLAVDFVDVPGVEGKIGMCACPGGRRVRQPDYQPVEDLNQDLTSLKNLGANGLVSLIEESELQFLGLDILPIQVREHDLWWKHLPIKDMDTPSRLFEQRWPAESLALHESLQRGESLVMHCWAGLGRTGMMTARLLVEFGLDPRAAVLRVRDVRPGAIQTRKQEKYVLKVKPR